MSHPADDAIVFKRTAMKIKSLLALGSIVPLLLAVPAGAGDLSKKDQDRVARAAPEDQEALAQCLQKKKKGAKTGTIAGGATGAGAAIIGGASLGGTVLAAGAGAVAGNLIGKGASTNKDCDALLKKYK
jgi:hypothetical protein